MQKDYNGVDHIATDTGSDYASGYVEESCLLLLPDRRFLVIAG